MAAFCILVICTGNIHRSPLAAALLETWADWYLPAPLADDVRIRSAGLAAAVGAPMSDRVQVIARQLGADGSGHVARQLTDDMIVESDLVLVASRRQRGDVLGRVPAALRKTFTIREAGRTAASLPDPAKPQVARDLRDVVARLADTRIAPGKVDDDDIIDPQGLGDEAYVRMTVDEVAALVPLAHALLGMPRADVDAYRSAMRDRAAVLVDSSEADA